MRFVLDAGVALAWFLPDEQPEDRSYAYDVLRSMREGAAFAVVPLLWHEEIAHALLRERRAKRLSAGRFVGATEGLGALDVETDLTGTTAQLLIARGLHYHLQGFDAVYFHLAKMRALPIAAIDRGLRTACRSHGVKLFQPKAAGA